MNQSSFPAAFPKRSGSSLAIRRKVWLFGLSFALAGCYHQKAYQYEDAYYRVSQVASLPEVVNESSGLALAADTNALWTLNDGGGKNELYQVDRRGHLLSTLVLPGTRNVDWEELAKDSLGYLYVGDFGNNWSLRRDLKIYRVQPSQPRQISLITFRYADQQGFPPVFTPRNFDCEAFFWYRDSLYLFSKNWSGLAEKLYILPAAPGDYVAQVKDTATLDNQADRYDKKTLVTSADISPDGKWFALLTYGKVFLFKIERGMINFRHLFAKLDMDKDETGQIEALVFINNTDFVFTNEEGKIFLARRK